MALTHQQSRVAIGKWLYQRFLTLVIYPSIWVATGLASLGYFVQEVLGLPHDWRALIFLFAAALLPYNLDRLLDSLVQPIPDAKVQSYFRQPGIWLLPVTAAFTIGFLLYWAPQQVRLASCGGVIPLIYGFPLFPLGQGKKRRWHRLKDIPGIKSWIVAGIITYALVAIPLAYANGIFDQSAALLMLFLLIITGTNAHLFDVRDIDSDREKRVLTLPLIIGIQGTRFLWTGLNLLLLAVLIGFWMTRANILSSSIVVPMVLVNVGFIWFLHPETPRNVYSIGLDGCLFLPVLLSEVVNFSN